MYTDEEIQFTAWVCKILLSKLCYLLKSPNVFVYVHPLNSSCAPILCIVFSLCVKSPNGKLWINFVEENCSCISHYRLLFLHVSNLLMVLDLFPGLTQVVSQFCGRKLLCYLLVGSFIFLTNYWTKSSANLLLFHTTCPLDLTGNWLMFDDSDVLRG